MISDTGSLICNLKHKSAGCKTSQKQYQKFIILKAKYLLRKTPVKMSNSGQLPKCRNGRYVYRYGYCTSKHTGFMYHFFIKNRMKTFLVKVLRDADQGMVTAMLKKMAAEKTIEFEETILNFSEPESATEDQVQEIIDESELGPYYSEKEAKDILNL